jgi:ADP-heptose:LPS heptosyltransferase
VALADRSDRPLLLVLRALGLGDLLTAVPALRGLRRHFRAHRIVLATPLGLAPLVELLGVSDEILDTSGLQPLRPPGAVATAVNLHGWGPQSHQRLLATRPGRLVAFRHPGVPAASRGPSWCDDEHEVDRWCRLLRAAGIACDPSDLHVAPPPAPSWMPVGATVVHAGAASAARRWPEVRFVELVRHEQAAGRAVVLTGDDRDAARVDRIARAARVDPRWAVAGRTDVAELLAVVAHAGRVVCGDTGVAHLATAAGTPSVVLFGPTAPRHWGPRSRRAPHRALWSGRPGDPHADRVDPGLLEIGVGDVVTELARLPAPPGPTRPQVSR